jgi:hypothetical protein
MATSIYLINPRSASPGYFGAEMVEHWGFPAAAGIADLAIATVAAFVPRHWQVTVCDELVEPVELDHPAPLVGITGKITQASRMITLAQQLRRRGKTVIVGGPFASLSPEVMRPHCDVLVVGELEAIAGELFADLERGDFRDRYDGARPDLASSPQPRWDLYPHERALEGCVQTSRGCPFQCDFCDVIQYLGRRQRHKGIDQILAELEALYALGHRVVFLADDNFTAYRRRAKEVLAALRDWNLDRREGAVAFHTQLSIDAARDPAIMELLAEAGMVSVFIGIETPNVESLRESKKLQNVGVDLLGAVQVFLDYGIAVMGGMIVGFDADGLDIFERQYEFAMASPIPIFSLGALVAPAATPLHERMAASGRLVAGGSEVAATPWDTNIVPARMSRAELFSGLKWLGNRLYSPESFTRRTLSMVERLGPRRGPFAAGRERLGTRRRPVDSQVLSMLARFVRSGPAERRMWATLRAATAPRPHAASAATWALARYAQVRCLYERGGFWEPLPAESSPFAAGSAVGHQVFVTLESPRGASVSRPMARARW